jgi:hypothetical protein
MDNLSDLTCMVRQQLLLSLGRQTLPIRVDDVDGIAKLRTLQKSLGCVGKGKNHIALKLIPPDVALVWVKGECFGNALSFISDAGICLLQSVVVLMKGSN